MFDRSLGFGVSARSRPMRHVRRLDCGVGDDARARGAATRHRAASQRNRNDHDDHGDAHRCSDAGVQLSRSRKRCTRSTCIRARACRSSNSCGTTTICRSRSTTRRRANCSTNTSICSTAVTRTSSRRTSRRSRSIAIALDDALKRGDLDPAFDIFNRYQARLEERLEFLITELDQGLQTMNFTPTRRSRSNANTRRGRPPPPNSTTCGASA